MFQLADEGYDSVFEILVACIISIRTFEEVTLHAALEEALPCRYWVEINKLLVPFGKHVCTAHLPKCSTCPLLKYCRQIGVTAHR